MNGKVFGLCELEREVAVLRKQLAEPTQADYQHLVTQKEHRLAD